VTFQARRLGIEAGVELRDPWLQVRARASQFALPAVFEIGNQLFETPDV
jgi:hypothetical protein